MACWPHGEISPEAIQGALPSRFQTLEKDPILIKVSQIHDYLQVSVVRRDAVVKTATNRTIETLGRYYPETLSRKFFVNVPVVAGWIYAAMSKSQCTKYV